MSPRKEPLLVAALTLAALLPFAGKAFHIDDTLFLETARQIRSNPIDFYGFSINWYGTEQPMSDVTKNPPLAAYFLALASTLFGWSELALHGAFLLVALAAALGIYALASRLTTRPIVAALAAIATPAFLVSSTNVMCDTMLVAFWTWAVERWIRGIDTGRSSPLLSGSALAAFAALTKYFGIALIPLLFAYALAKKRRLGSWAMYLVLPVAVLAGYHAWTRAKYGRSLLFDAASYATVVRSRFGMGLPDKLLVGLSFAGGALASATFIAPWIWRARAFVVAGAVLALGTAFLAAQPAGAQLGPTIVLQLVLFAIAGLGILVLPIADLLRRRSADALLLALWILGTFAFAAVFNWTVNARSLLPAAPAMGILVARRLEARPGTDSLAAAIPLLLAFALSIAVARADTVLADTARTAAARIAAGPSKARIWFEGHWGFQYYMERAGATPVDVVRSRLSAGDRIAVPINASNLAALPGSSVALRETLTLPVTKFLATLSPAVKAGFYADIWGPLPFAFGRVPPERYVVLEVLREISPGEIGR